jgi:hypothetical protein
MRLSLDIDTRKPSSWSGAFLERLWAARHDRMPVEVRFTRFNMPCALPEGAVGRVGIKAPGDQEGALVVFSNAWVVSTPEGDSAPTYTFTLDLNTVAMEALFADSPERVPMTLEIEWQYEVGGTLCTQTSRPLPINITNDYIKGTEGTPGSLPDYKATLAEALAGTANDKWMTPLLVSQIINNRDDVLDFTAVNQFPTQGDKGKIYMAGSVAYAWTGTAYEKISRDSTFNSPIPPANPEENDRWIDSTTFIAYDYVGGNWIQTSV